MAGRCGCAGRAVNPAARSGPAAGGCAFGRLRSSASQAKRPHPWGLDGAIHGANGPAHPHRPTSDRSSRLLVGVDLGRHICQISKSIWSQIRFPPENGSDPKRISNRSRKTVEGGVGPVAGVSAAWMPRPSPHGWVYGVSRNRTRPAIQQEASFCFCCCFGSCRGRGLCRCRAQPCR